MSDIYADENLNVVQGNEIGDSGPAVHAPDAHRLAGLDATHHHDADYGPPDTTVTVAEGAGGTTVVCTHGGRSYLTSSPRLKPGDSCFIDSCPSALGAGWSYTVSTG
jgi:hypothetical protein